jgi:hypothetical protein
MVVLLLSSGLATAEWQTVFQLGAPGRGFPRNQGGVIYVQELNTNPTPGDPMSPPIDLQADDDYYVAGTYPAPIGSVPDELVAERAFGGTDNDLRFHFNLPSDLNPRDRFRFSFEAWNMHQNDQVANPHYGVEVLVNGTLVMPEQTIRLAELRTVLTTPEFTAADVGLLAGAGEDNVVWMRGINHFDDGGSSWMSLDYQHLEFNQIPEPTSLGMMLIGLVWALLRYRRNAF